MNGDHTAAETETCTTPVPVAVELEAILNPTHNRSQLPLLVAIWSESPAVR
jgi:hypothetical protein